MLVLPGVALPSDATCDALCVCVLSATWYFLYPQGQYSNPTLASWKRAVTTSFGSICLGSLVLSIVRALRVTVNMMASQPGQGRGGAAARACFYCIAQCLLSILDRVVEFVNQFAFAQVAIYGKSAAHERLSRLPLTASATLITPSALCCVALPADPTAKLRRPLGSCSRCAASMRCSTIR